MAETVLVTGGAGYIGSHLVSLLLDAGYSVRLLDLNMYDSPSFSLFSRTPGCTVLQGDMRHIEDLAPAVRGASLVVDLAAIVGDEACNKDKEAAEMINLQATELLFSLCRRYSVKRLVFASTCSVYGASGSTSLTEDSPTNPLSLYAETKLESEKVLLGTPSSTEVVILRLATVYGLSRRMRFDLVLNFFAARAATGQPLVVYGGDQVRPLIHVRDAARAFAACIHPSKSVAGQILNAGSEDHNFTISELATRVQALLPGTVLSIRPAERDLRDYRVSFEKIARLLDFRPETSIEQGISEILQALRSGQVSDYLEDKYYNVKYVYRNA